MFVVAAVEYKESSHLGTSIDTPIVDKLSATLPPVTGPSDVRELIGVAAPHPKKERGKYIMLLIVVLVGLFDAGVLHSTNDL